MRYKSYVWPHNPRIYTIEYERAMACSKIPFGLYYLQDLGRTYRVMRGEGEFSGPDAYAQFGALANVFYSDGPGVLIHPLWQTANAYFVELRLKQEPKPDYISYTFTFWEDLNYYDTALRSAGSATTESGDAAESGSETYRVVQGDTLWSIAKRYGVTLADLLERNPQIKNPNLIRVGQEVHIR